LGEIASVGEYDGDLGTVHPEGSRGRVPVRESGGEAPRSWKLFAA